jgi:hypothetical protein
MSIKGGTIDIGDRRVLSDKLVTKYEGSVPYVDKKAPGLGAFIHISAGKGR